MADYDPYSALTLDEPTAAEMARARAAALRGQNFAGLVGSLAHDPYASRSGAAMMDQAQQGLTQLGQLPGARLKQALGQQELQQAGPQAALGGETPSIYKLLTARKEAEANRLLRQQLATMPSYGVNPTTGQLYNKRGGGAGPAQGAPIPGAGAAPAIGPAAAPQHPPLAGKMLDKALKELGQDFDPSGARSGEFGKNQARINSATRLLQLATDENGQPKDLNPQQMPELTQALTGLISGGGAGAQAQIEHMTPKTLRGDLQRTIQWVTGNPRGADQVAFVQNMIDTAKREKDVAQKGIDQVRSQRAAKHQQVIFGNPDESRRVLQGFGWDLGPDGMPEPKQAAAPAAPQGEDADAIAWAKANAADPRAQKILRLHGMAK